MPFYLLLVVGFEIMQAADGETFFLERYERPITQITSDCLVEIFLHS